MPNMPKYAKICQIGKTRYSYLFQRKYKKKIKSKAKRAEKFKLETFRSYFEILVYEFGIFLSSNFQVTHFKSNQLKTHFFEI